MPAIQDAIPETPDGRDEPWRAASKAAGDELKVSAALGDCLRVLDDRSRPLESRYGNALSTCPLIESRLAAGRPGVPADTQTKILKLLQPHPQLHPPEAHDGAAAVPALPLFHSLSESILSVLRADSAAPSAELVAVLASFCSLEDPWTTTRTHRLATTLLLSDPAFSSPEIFTELLASLKPLFTTPTPSSSRLTPSSRLALRETTNPHTAVSPPSWLQRPAVISILTWTVSSLPATHIEHAWGLLIPPLLTLLDSTDSRVKARAITNISTLLLRAPGDLLQRTGLHPVFWDSIVRCLSYLPPLTPSPQSVPLLRSTHRALLTLASLEPDKTKRGRLLDQVVREGFLRAIKFADEYVHVILAFVAFLPEVVDTMGVGFAKHLRNVIPKLADLLAMPFADSFPPLLLAACEALVAAMRVCWMRIGGGYRDEVLRGACILWGRIEGEGKETIEVRGKPVQIEGEGKETIEVGGEPVQIEGEGEGMMEVRGKLVQTVRVLRAVVVKECGEEEWAKIKMDVVAVDEVFAGLFEG